jgi:hypothetical protein
VDPEIAAQSMLAKLRDFMAQQLDAEERAMLAALLTPGIARAYVDREVEGFGLVDWLPETLPTALATALRQSDFLPPENDE